jgi:hypothetical protein
MRAPLRRLLRRVLWLAAPVQLGLCLLIWRVRGRLDLRPVVFCAFLPLITTVCIRGMRQAETEHGADLWDVAFVLSLLCAVIALLAVYVR